MDDIKRPYRNSRSKGVHQAPLLRAHQRELYKKVEEFESDEYASSEEATEGNDIRSYYTKVRQESERKPYRITKFSLFSGISIIFLITLVLCFSFIWNRATINITPRVYAFTVDTEINLASTTLGYFASSSDSTKKTLERSEKRKVESKANGEITIYNNYSENSQKLVKNTRFETSAGVIFRITDSVVVPGKTGSTPGSTKAKVTADSFGEQYNIKPSKFTIPGFKNSPRYEGFYAESYSDMKGGANSEKYVVSDEAIALADTAMQNTIKQNLMKNTFSKQIEGYIYATNTIYFVYSNNLDDYESGKASEYEVYGTAYVYMLDRRAFSDKLAKIANKNYNKDDAYYVQDYSTLNINPKSDMQKDKSITVKGKGNLIYGVDFTKVKQDLIGKNEAEYSDILSRFSSIEKADISISPFWVHTFPSNPDKLKIKEVLP